MGKIPFLSQRNKINCCLHTSTLNSYVTFQILKGKTLPLVWNLDFKMYNHSRETPQGT